MNLEIEKNTTARPLTEAQMADWREIVLREFPKEACAYIVGGKVIQVPNLSQEPLERFAVDPYVRFELESQGHISGFLHSHCHPQKDWEVYWPSGADMTSWLNDDLRWGISACDGETVTRPVWLDEDYVAPLNGRVFIHGIHDCYAAVRDWFRLNRGITLKNYARGMEWWLRGQDLYSQQFEEAGFVEIKSNEAQPGDCAMFAVNSRGIISHAAVITGGNTMYHHSFSRLGSGLSGEVEIGRWNKHIVKFVRYIGND